MPKSIFIFKDLGDYLMALESVQAEQLHGYQFFHHPDSVTAGILRLDTENEQHWVMVTRKTLLMLSDALKQHADELEELQ
jgi:hypothetical protein